LGLEGAARLERRRSAVGKLIHPKLSDSVRGVLPNVRNRLGPLLKEAY